MNLQKRIENIKLQENRLDRAEELARELEDLLKQLKILLPEYRNLLDYYSDQQWREDYEESNKGTFQGIKFGVLSQDAVYDLIFHFRELNLEMIRTATDYLSVN